MTTDEIMALGGQLVARNVRQLQGLGSEAETRESYVALRSAIEALQADAARYRWLRDKPTWTVDQSIINGPAEWKVEFDSDYGLTEAEDELDAVIDAAMALDKP